MSSVLSSYYGIKNANASVNAQMSLQKITMQTMQTNAQNLVNVMKEGTPAPHPYLGKNIDVRI